MKIKILGTDCPNCRLMEQNVRTVIRERAINAEIIKEKDIVKIMNSGIMRMPGLMVNEKIVVNGRVPSKAEISEIFTKILK